MTEQVEVTDADRKFVASRYSMCGDIHRRILAGEYDAFDDVQSAARFRIQSTAEVTAQRDALAEALEDAKRGLTAMTIALEEQEFFTVAARLRTFVERAETTLTLYHYARWLRWALTAAYRRKARGLCARQTDAHLQNGRNAATTERNGDGLGAC